LLHFGRRVARFAQHRVDVAGDDQKARRRCSIELLAQVFGHCPVARVVAAGRARRDVERQQADIPPGCFELAHLLDHVEHVLVATAVVPSSLHLPEGPGSQRRTRVAAAVGSEVVLHCGLFAARDLERQHHRLAVRQLGDQCGDQSGDFGRGVFLAEQDHPVPLRVVANQFHRRLDLGVGSRCFAGRCCQWQRKAEHHGQQQRSSVHGRPTWIDDDE